MSTTVLGGPFDGAVLEDEISVILVPIAHSIDDKLVGVAWHRFEPGSNLLRFCTYEPSL